LTTQVAAFTVAGFVLHGFLPSVMYNPVFHACLIVDKPRINVGYLWLPGLTFEVVVFFVVLWDALERPRTHNSEISKTLYRDGFLYFSVLFVLRLINLVLGFIAPLSLIFLGVLFVWCAVNITLSHLILNSRQLASDHGAEVDAVASTQRTSREVSIDSIVHLGYVVDIRLP